MILEKESEIKVLRSFYDNPFDYFSIAEISRNIKLSRNWIYRIINKFEKSMILLKSGKRYKLDFSNLFCKQLKLLFDSEYLNSLDQTLKNSIFSIANKLIFETSPESLILVGSTALNRQTKKSDIDFLVIGENKKVPPLKNCNLIILNKKELGAKYLAGDDFVIFSLLFGKIIYDKQVFIKFFESPLPVFSQEVIQEKIRYCERLEERIYTLLKTDENKAKEELLYLALQVARIILLKNKIVPRAKYDISSQVKPFDKEIAGIIKELLEKEKISKEKMLSYIRICMEIIK